MTILNICRTELYRLDGKQSVLMERPLARCQSTARWALAELRPVDPDHPTRVVT